jgi:hypothetical protein
MPERNVAYQTAAPSGRYGHIAVTTPARQGDQQAARQRGGQPRPCQVAAVAGGDDHGGQDVVDGGDGQHEQPHSGGCAASDESQDADGEGRVGGHGNAPARCGRTAPRDGQEHRCGHGGAAEGGQRGHGRRAGVGQLADGNLAFDFQADGEEEHRHQSVVDPMPGIVRKPCRAG